MGREEENSADRGIEPLHIAASKVTAKRAAPEQNTVPLSLT